MQRIIIPSLFIAVALFVIARFNYYVFVENDSNHTAFPVMILALSLAALAIISMFASRRTHSDLARSLWLVLAVLAILAAANVVAFNMLHIMMEHDPWTKSGMPERPAWSLPPHS